MSSSCSTCAVLTIVLAFPVAILFGIFFPTRANAVFMFFGIIEGGFLFLAVLGAAAGAVAHEIAKRSKLSPVAIRLGLSLVAAVVAGFVWVIMVD